MRSVSDIRGRLIFGKSSEYTERVGRTKTKTLVVVLVMKVVARGGGGGGRGGIGGIIGFGIITSEENDVVFVELVAPVGTAGGARVFQKRPVRYNAEESLGRGGLTVGQQVRIVEIHDVWNSKLAGSSILSVTVRDG